LCSTKERATQREHPGMREKPSKA